MHGDRPGWESDARIEYIDLAKAIGIILVIAGHVVSSDTDAKKVIYSFHMPLFFLLSGMLMMVRDKYSRETWETLITKKAKGLLTPYILWGLIYASFSFKHTALILYGTRETLIAAESLTSLWFLPVMFLAFLIAEVVLQISSRVDRHWFGISAGVIVLATIGFLAPHHPKYGDPWGIDIAFVAASFMLVGILLKAGVEKLTDNKIRIVILIVSLLLFIITVRHSDSSIGYVLMANAEYGNVIRFFLCALFGCVAVLMASLLLSRCHIKIAQSIGQKTLGVFLVHKPIVELGRSVVTKLGFSFDNPIFVLLITIVTLVVSFVIVTIIEMIIPELIGLKQKTNRGKT